MRVGQLHYPGRGLHTRVITVDLSKVNAAMAQLRSMRGVSHVARVTYRHRLAITANDPYYVGFDGTSPPYFEAPSIPGQWDMHAIDLDGAWSQFASAPVVGAPIAVVDTGVDVTHPELQTPSGVPGPKIIRTQCFVTFPATQPQTTGAFVTDMDGHGTNVAGIADGDTNNAFAFAGVAFDAKLLAYRIFPTPPNPVSACEDPNPPAQCDASSADEADAINDAVAHGAKVINLSLGASPPCATDDPEYIAVENAIGHGVVVVAASGNESTGALDCPAQDPGVIAAGASALDDSNPLAITEYVPTYSNWSPTGAQPGGGAYLVAPGGDPAGSSDSDDLHWIEHIYSSTAVEAGDCGTDFANETGNCRILIAGTSMATPHIAGVASLMLAKNPNLTPLKVAQGLCDSADDIGDFEEGCGRLNAAAAVTWAATH
jgi:subtilisin family serine protease